MKPGAIAAIVVGVLAVAGGAIILLSEPSSVEQTTSSSTVPSNSVASETEELDVDPERMGTYTDYAPELVSNTEGYKVLFFHAPWCPTCRSLDRNINAGTIPGNINIYKVDYDSEQALKEKYGITYQHTLVQVDNEGNQIKKWSGSFNIEEIQEELI